MPIYRANDLYRANLRTTWIASPADTTLSVTSIPDNLPTIVTVGWKTDYETKFTVTGSSGDSPSNYVLTGATVISGGTENISELTPVNCLNHEEFFNQYETVVGGLTDMYETTGLELTQIATPANPASGKNKIYFKSDNKAYTLTSAGVETAVGSSVADTEVFIIPGTLPSSATTNISKTWFAPANLTLSKIDLYVGTAGASTGSTVIDVNKNGTTVCASTKPTLTTTETSDLDITPSTTAVSKGDAITIDVDSTTATAPVDAYILIHYTRD